MIYAPRDEGAIKAIEDQLQSIERVNYSKAKQIEGMLAGLRGDTKKVRSKFNTALRSSGNDIFILVNFAQALANLHCMVEAVEYIDSAATCLPDDVELLSKAIEIHMNAYDVNGFQVYLERLNHLGFAERISQNDIQFCTDASEMMLDLGATWEQVAERLEVAAEAVFSIGMASPGFTRTIVDTGLLVEFNIFGSLENALSTEREIQARIAGLPYCAADRFISFSCAPV